MNDKKPVQPATSHPTMCLHCHIIVEMKTEDFNAKDGAWVCQRCGHRYLFTHWKIRKARGQSQ